MGLMRAAACGSVAALLAGVLSVPPAAADRHTRSDPDADMVEVLQGDLSAAPAHREADVHRVVVRHTNRVLMIRTWVRELTRPDHDSSVAVGGYIKVDRSSRPGKGAGWYWNASPLQRRDGSPTMGGKVHVYEPVHGRIGGCSSNDDERAKVRFDYARDRVTVILPRDCLSNASLAARPRWVRVSVFTRHSLVPYVLDGAYDPSRPDYYDSAWGPHGLQMDMEDSHFTPRLHPG
jgi:hypothetical protein